MGHHSKNDELREDRFDQEARRQDVRDEVIDESNGRENDDLGSQDERRKEGKDAPDPDDLFRDNR